MKWCGRALVFAYVLFLTIGLTWPLVGFFDQHENYAYFQRLEALAEGWRSQGVHPRWSPDLAAGHGYALFNFYPPGFSYIGLLFYPLGVVPAVKIAGTLMTLVGTLSAYGLGRSLSGTRGGILAATLCATAPYTYCNLYWRGDFGEYAAFFGATAALWALVVALRRGMPGRSALVFAVIYGLFVPLHTISSLLYSGLFALLAGGYALHARYDLRRWVKMIGAFAGGLALSAWYWLPALAEKSLVSTDNMLTGYYEVEHHFAQLPQYFTAFTWGAPVLGPVVPAALLFVAVLSFRRRRRFLPIALAVLAIGCIVVNFPVSKPFWQNMPLIRYVQFPWRFNGPAVLLSAAAASACVKRLPRVLRRIPMLVVSLVLGTAAVIAMAVSTDQLTWLEVTPAHAGAGPSIWLTTSARNEFLPKTAVPDAVQLNAPLVQTQAAVVASRISGTDITATVDASTDTPVSFRQWAHSGWRAYIDGEEAEWQPDAAGRLSIIAPAGRHDVRFELRRTTTQCAAEWISAIAAGLALVAGGALLYLKRKDA